MEKHLSASARVFIITILITFLLGPGLHAAEEPLPKPEEIVAKNIEVMGGIKALNRIKNKKTVSISKFVQMNMVIKLTEYRERPDNVFLIFRRLDKEVREGSIGKKEWLDMGVMESFDRKITWEGSDGKIAWEMSPEGVRLFDLASYLREHCVNGPDGPDAHYKSMKTEGIEQINGRE